MKTYPLLQTQVGIFVDCLKYPESTQYNLPSFTILTKNTDLKRLEEALYSIYKNRKELRIRFKLDSKGNPIQYVSDDSLFHVIRRKMKDADLWTYGNGEFIRPYDLLGDEPLFRAEIVETEKTAYLLMDYHHILMDGVSSTYLFLQRDIPSAYMQQELVKNEYGMLEYAQDEILSGEHYERDRKYFLEKFKGCILATMSNTNTYPVGKMIKSSTFINIGDVDKWCVENKLPVDSLFQAAFSHVLAMYMRSDKVAYCMMGQARYDKKIRESYGMYVNTIPFMVEEKEKMTVTEFIKACVVEKMGVLRHHFYPFTHFCSELHVTPGIGFNFIAMDKVEESICIDGKECPLIQQMPHSATEDMTVSIYRAKNDDYEIRVTSSEKLNNKEFLDAFSNAVLNTVLNMMENPQMLLCELSTLSKEEENNICEMSTGEVINYGKCGTWVDLFGESVEKYPEHTAIVDMAGSITYRQLEEQSDFVASYLLSNGIKENEFVAVKTGRVKEYAIAILGILKAGAAYVPIDIEYPKERIRYMLEDSQAKVVLTEELVKKIIEDYNGKYYSNNRINHALRDNYAYMIYTSGSTGRPKGVVQSHGSLYNFVKWRVDKLCINHNGNYGHFNGFAFDGSLDDLVCPLAAGATVHILDDELRRNIVDLDEYISKNNINGMTASTQFGMELIKYNPNIKLDYLMMGGERLFPCKESKVKLINGYGPTEFTVCSSYYVVNGDEKDIPIGRPVPNTASYICDINGNLVAKGIVGELCLAGAQMAVGYWKQPELTAKSFGEIVISGKKIKVYKTGDLVRYNEQGQLEYIGRNDSQIKLRGYRVELGEIENQANKIPYISQSVADVRNGQIVLYYTTNDKVSESENIEKEIHEIMEECLADYMIPSIYMKLDEFPLTPNGKIDKKALPQPEVVFAQDYVKPETEQEVIIAECMQKILGGNYQIGVLDSFFAFGGDSIKAIRLVSLLREKGINIRVSDIMNKKTIRAIAACVADTDGENNISQEEVCGFIDDSAIVGFFKDLKLPNPSHFTQSVLLKATEKIDIEKLQSALNVVTSQHDMLRAILKDGSLYVQGKDTVININEYQAKSEMEVTSTCNNIVALLDMEKSLFCIALIHMENSDYIFVSAHHLIIDGVSLRILISDLKMSYIAAIKGEQIKLPAKTSSYAAYVEALKQYRNSYNLEKEITYWNNIQNRLMKLPVSALKDYNRKFKNISVSMDNDFTNAFVKLDKDKMALDTNDVLVTALARAYNRISHSESVSLQLEGHGRENIKEGLVTDRTIGWFTSIYPVVIDGVLGTEDEASIKNDLIRVKQELHSVPNKGVGYNVLRYMNGEELANYSKDYTAQIGFNYLGEMDLELNVASAINMTAKENCFGPDIDINCMVLDGCFNLSISYNESLYDEGKAGQFANFIIEEINRVVGFINKCDENIITPTDLGENEWSFEEFETVLRDFGARGEKISRIYPLLPMQEGILYKHISEPNSWAYRLATVFEMNALPTEENLRKAIDRISAKYEVLRTAIVYENVSVARQVITNRILPFDIVDVSNEKDKLKAVKKLRKDIISNYFDLTRKSLFKLVCAKKDDTSCYLIVAVHHIIVDGWSLQNYMADLFEYLKEEITGADNIAKNESESFDGLYELYVRKILELDKKEGLKYWSGLLSDYESRAEIPAYGVNGTSTCGIDDEVIITIDKNNTEKLSNLCKEERATISNGVELVWGLVLLTYGNLDDAVFAKVVSGRDKIDTDISELTGLFINSIPVRVKIDKEITARKLLRNLQEQAAQSNKYDYCALSDIQQQTALGKQLLQTVLAFENYNSGADIKGSLTGQAVTITPVVIKEENYGELNVTASVTKDDELCIYITFDNSMYSKEQVESVGKLFSVLLEGVVSAPDKALSMLPRISGCDRDVIYKLSTADKIEFDKNKTWLDMFWECVKKYPDKLAVADSNGSITYAELNRQSDIIAGYLVQNGIEPNSFVALKMERVKEFVIAVVGIHKAGVAYVPIDLSYPVERINYMLDNSQSKIVLTEDKVRTVIEQSNGDEKFDIVATPNMYAYMIYTSGTTGKPKGVVIHHGALMNYTVATIKHNELTCDDRIGHHFSFSFDSHIEDIYPPLSVGAGVFIMPENIRREPELIYEFLNDNKITGMGFTTTIGKIMVSGFDLKLRYIALMGEPLTDVVSTSPKILNKYGPTECTNISAWYEMEYGRRYRRIPIGRPMDNGYMFIIDRNGNLLPKGIAGEICYAGPQVGQGYWRLDDKTKEVFMDCPFVNGMRMYRTGDLGRYNDENQIECLGRIDNQIKLRGYRIELGEIESCANAYPDIKQVVADVKNDQLVLYYISEQIIDEIQLKDFLSERLAQYMVPTFYIAVSDMPTTPSGKVDRRKLAAPKLSDTVKIEPENDLEKELLAIAFEILGTDNFGVTDNMVSLGLSSIAVMRFSAGIFKVLGKRISVVDIMKAPTIRRIAENIQMTSNTSADKSVVLPMEKMEYYPITENQKGVYLDWEMNRQTTQYNVPSVYVFDNIDIDRLAGAIRQVVDAHSYLKTRFEYINGELMQKPCDEKAVIDCIQLDNAPDIKYFQEKVRPFNLLNDRLYRIEVISHKDKAWLFIDVHHIIYDGLSSGLLINDILNVYKGEVLTKESVNAYDFSLFEQSYKESGDYKAAKDYFDGLVKGAETLVYPDSINSDEYDYETVSVQIPSDTIDLFCQKNNVTPGSFMQAAFAETLKRITREDGSVYVTISNGRTVDSQLLNCIGMFARTLPVVIGTSDNLEYTTSEYVKAMYNQIQQTLEYELYPYTKIVEDYGIHAQIMFVFQGGVFESGDVEGISQLPLQLNAVKFAISATAYPYNENYVISLEYDGRRYCKEDMQIFATSIGNVALGLSKKKYLKDVCLLNNEKENEIYKLSTGDKLDYDRSLTWVDMFTQAVKDYPNNVAVADSTSSITYSELDRQSDAVAGYLIANAVAPNDFVAIKMDRVKEFVTAVIGIHKAGCAYVPIDASYPSDRIKYMLEDSNAKVVITQELLDEILKENMVPDKFNYAKPQNLAYMIYTSGSTGKPKGAMVPHSALHNFVHFIIKRLNMRPESRVACHTSFSFDVTVENLFPVLCAGGCTIIVPEAVRKDVDLLYGFFKDFKVTGTHITTQMGQLLGNQYTLDMEYIRLSGEAMTSIPKCTGHVYNAYGPTECTVDVTDCEINSDFTGRTIPIGKPMSGSSVFVVDQYGKLLPQGIAGELYLGGLQVGAGYYNKPEMTDEKFININLLGKTLRVYKSGDLGRYLHDGQIEYLGRMDNQVKFRGFRIELGEIECRAMLYPAIEQAVAMVKNEQLVLYYTKKTDGNSADISDEDIKEFLAHELTDYMLPTVYICMENMPLTPNGKVNRKALPEPRLTSSENFVEPNTIFEITVAQCMQNILGLNDRIGALDSFFALGGDSIKAIRLISLLREKDMQLRVSDIMNLKTVRAIALCASDRRNAVVISQEPIEGEVDDSAIVSYYKDLRLPVASHFNQSVILRLRDRADIGKLQMALNAVTYQHDMLRAILKNQKLYIGNSKTVIKIKEYDTPTLDEVIASCNKLQTQIDMESGLLKVTVFHTKESDLLFIIAHHLVIDGVSWRILISDLGSAYRQTLNGEEIILPAKTSTYRDYVEILKKYRNSYSLEKEIVYWDEVQARMENMTCSLMKDYGRSFGNVSMAMDEEETSKVIRANRENLNLEINDILITAVARAFARLTGKTSMSFQLEGHGREYIEDGLVTDRTIGWFTTVYPVVLEKITCEGTNSIENNLINVKETMHRIPKKGMGYNLLRYLDGNSSVNYSKDNIAMIGFNYLGEMDVAHGMDGLFKIDNTINMGCEIAPQNCYGPNLDINCIVTEGCFKLDLSFNKEMYDDMTAQKFVQTVKEELINISQYLDTSKHNVLTASDLGENEWNMEQFETVIRDFAAEDVSISRIYPLTPLQEGMLYKHISDSESWGYRLVYIYEAKCIPSDIQLRRVLDRLGRKYEVLRTAIVYENVPVARQVITDRDLPFKIVDISGEADTFKAACRIREDIMTNGFELMHKSLFQLVCAKKDEESCYMIVATHHIIADGWSIQNYMTDFFTYIGEELTGKKLSEDENADGALDGIYEKYVRQILDLDKNEGLKYWGGLLEGYEKKAQIPSHGEIPVINQSKTDDYILTINRETTKKLNTLCMEEKATISNAVELAWGLVLQTYSYTDDAVFAKVVSGRDKTQMELGQMAGLFINSVPVRVNIDENATTRQMLGRLCQQTAQSNAYDYCPLSEIQQQSELGSELLQTVLAFENYNSGAENVQNKGLEEFAIQPLVMKEENFDEMHVTAYVTAEGELCLHIATDKRLYSAEEINRVLELFRVLVENMVDKPDEALIGLPRLNAADSKAVCNLSYGGELNYPMGETWVDLFLNSVRKYPDYIAVVDSDSTITYRELDEQSNSVAAYILSKGIKKNSFVAIRMERIKEYMVAILGVFKAGCGYLPIDSEYPESRIQFMLEDAEVKLILTRKIVEEVIAEYANAKSVNYATPENYAYMIYTSGSTGKPKGVLELHRCLYHFANWTVKTFGYKHEGAYGLLASFSFDGSLIDYASALAAGGTLHIFNEELRRNLIELEEYISKNKILGLYMPTLFGVEMAKYNPSLSVDFLLIGGTKLLPYGDTSFKVYNVYGPTEFTILSTYYLVEDGNSTNVPLGYLAPGLNGFVCDKHGNLVPRGVEGELYLAGAQISDGYWKRPELTSEKFVEFNLNGKGIKAYRTGDLARYNEDGLLEYYGRIDSLIKLRGFRVELGEIENRAMEYPMIEYAVVDVKKDQLVLYYTLKAAIEEEPSIDDISSFIAETLAEYMVPTFYVKLDSIPKTTNGKVDRKALPEPQVGLRQNYVKPSTKCEITVAQAMQKILGMEEPVGALDSFFALGGDSIKAIRLVSLLRENGIQIRVSDVMKFKTVRAIAGCAKEGSDELSRMISQEPIEGTVTDSAIVSFYKDINLPEPEASRFTQSMLFRMREKADIKTLQKALDKVTMQHDMLRSVVKDGSLYVRKADVTINIEEYETDMEKVSALCTEIQTNLDVENAMVRVALIHTKQDDRLFIVAHHLIIDGVSWRILSSDIETAYESLIKGEKVNLPVKTSSYQAYAQALERYQDSYSLSQEIPYWNNIQEHLMNMPVSKMKDFDRTFSTISVCLGKQETAEFIKADRSKLNLEINDILVAAVARAYCGYKNCTELSVQMEGHGREPIVDGLIVDRTIGWFTSIYPVVFDNITNAKIPKRDIINVKETLHCVPNKGIGYNVLRYLNSEQKTNYSKEEIAQVGFNYLGEMDAEQSQGGLFTVENGISIGEEKPHKNCFCPDLDLNSMIIDGSFIISLAYNEAIYTKKDVENLAYEIFAELKVIAGFINSLDEKITTVSDLGETKWTQAEFESVVDKFQKQGEHISRIYPLLPMQEGMLYKHISDPDSWAYRVVSIYEFGALPTENQLRNTLNRLSVKYEVLRTAIVYEGVSVARQVITDRHLPYEMRDVSNIKDSFESVCRIREEIMTNDFDLANKPLFKVVCAKKDETSCYLIVAIHHIIVDGWSQQNYLADMFTYLCEEIAGDNNKGREDFQDNSLDGIYEAYIRHIRTLDKREALSYWKELLDGYDTRAEIPTYGRIPEERQSSEDELVLAINKETTDLLAKLCQEEKATISNAVELAWGLVLQTYSNTNDAVFAKIVSGRDKADMDVGKLTGLFINSVPVRVTVDKDVTARQMIGRLQQQATVGNAYDYCPLSEIQQQTILKGQLLQTVFAFQNYNSGLQMPDNKASENIMINPLLLREETFDGLNVDAAINNKGELCLHITFDKALYTGEEIRRVMKLFKTFAQGIVKYPDRALSHLPRVVDEELKAVCELSKGEEIAYPEKRTWIDMFQKIVDVYPENTAVIDSKGSISYKELDKYSNKIAAYLISLGIKKNDFVAIRMKRVKEFAIAVIGIHKAGAAYVPIDTEYPEDRINYMLEDSEAKTVITEDIVQAIGGHEDVESVNLASYDNYAYMVYTSGSTGRPKGVIQSHNSLYHFACWRVDKLRIKQGGNYGHFNSFAFDGSLDDLISPLVAGATIHIFDEELRRSLIDMDKYIAEHNINGMTTATQFGMELIKYNPKLKLDYLMMGGEKLLPCKNIGFDIINGYGPTEFTVCSSYHVVMGGEENIPIGRPVPNTASYICDRYGNLVPEGVVGEICLAGPQMAEGYWKLPDITKEKFTTIKIGENLVKIYRTGDLGRYNEYGQLEYLGRTDNQVKLRGYRIELSEIDSQAILHPSIKRAVAAVKGDQIVLYYTLNDKETMAEISEKLKEFEGELKEFLAKKLTGYMVPTVYMCIDDIPSTPNGKVDINALPEPVISSSKKYIAPANQYEICIAKCIQDTLGINYQVGAFDNFYELGGDSIKAMRLISVLRKQNINLKIDDITMHNNVRQIAAIAQERVNENAINQEPINGKLQDSAIIGFFRYLDLPEPSLFAQSILLRMNKRANTDKLQQALNVLTKQHDMLRAVWDGEGLYVRNETAVIPIEEYDVLGGNKGDITKLCYKIKTGINMDTALLRVALIHCDSEDLLFMVAHHLIIDGVSWRVLLPDLETAYSQIMAGYAPILDAKTSNYRDYLEAQQAYRNSDGLKNEISYWNGIQQRLMSLDTSDIKDYNRSFEMLSASMEVENTAKVMGADRSKLSLDINDVMITAVARAYCSMAKVRDVSIQLEGHGRENIKEGLELDRTIGWFTSIYPVVISGITVNDNLYEDIVKVKETLHNIPNKGVGYNILRYVDGDERVCYSKDKIAKISFNYLGETSIDANENNMFGMVSDIDTGVVGLNENCFGSDLNINCMVENGRFSLSVSYNKGCYSEGQVRAMADSILEELVKEATYLDSLEGKITTVSDYGENVWTQEEFKIVQADFEGRGEHISGIRPINQELEEMIAQRERNLSRSGYEFVNIYEIDSLPTKDAINKALNRMEELYDVLNAAIVYKDVSVARCVLSDRRLKCTYIDAGNETNQQNYVKILRKELLLQKVDLQRDSLFKLYCVRKDDHSSYLIMAIAPMLCEICGLSDCLLSARFIAFLAGEMGRNFNITDIVNKQCRKEFVRGEHRVCGMYNEYDENKPTLVFMYGIIFQANIQHLLDDWSRKFNMVVFDTVNFHFKELFEGETFDDIVDLYMTLLEFIIPKKDKIFGFIGYSFGGELGFAMAERSSKLRNNKPVVFLGDTDMIPSMSTGAAKENLTMDDLDEYLIEKIKEHDIPQEGMLFAYSMLSYLNSKEKTIKPYDGQTVLLLALKDCSQSAVEVRILLAKKVAKDLKIVEFPKWDHFTLHTDVNLLGTYDKVLDEFI